ncbi:MAG TPA: hypothetical protein PKA19_00945 [Bacillota bacterium]|nr:hypothetical protein [Bacillota bacterium]
MAMIETEIYRRKSSRSVFDRQDLAELVARYGAPLYVFSETALKDNVRSILEKFRAYHPKTSVYYAANFESVVANLQIIRSAGCNLEVNSAGELYKGIFAGFRGNRILFNGAGKFDDEIEIAIINNVKSINADSELELKKIADIAAGLRKRADVSISITPKEVESGTVERMVRYALQNPEWISLKGYCFNSGIKFYRLKPLISALKEMLELAVHIYTRTGYRPDLLNIGGGLPMPSVEESAKELCAELSEEKVMEWAGEKNAGLFKDTELILEPGRKIAASVGILLPGTRRKREMDLQEPAEAVPLITLTDLSTCCTAGIPGRNEKVRGEIILIREDGQIIPIKPAQKYGDLIREKVKP